MFSQVSRIYVRTQYIQWIKLLWFSWSGFFVKSIGIRYHLAKGQFSNESKERKTDWEKIQSRESVYNKVKNHEHIDNNIIYC